MTNTDIQTNPESLIKLGIEKGVDVDQLEKLMGLQERWNDRQAKKAFLLAMSEFQAQCPVLEKTKQVAFNQVKYSYAPLGHIIKEIKDLLARHGLSYRWEIEDKQLITVICFIYHIDGHVVTTSMSADKDSSGKKNEIQQRGSTITYLQRYTLIGALGLATADEDNDTTDQKQPEYTDLETARNKLRNLVNKLEPIAKKTWTDTIVKKDAAKELDLITINLMINELEGNEIP